MACHRSVSRRSYAKYAGSLGLAGLAGCLGGAGGSDEVRIGALSMFSGPVPLFGQENRRGYEFASEVLDGEILGRELNIIEEDTQGKPDVGASKFRQLVEEDNVHGVIGPVVDPVTLAIRPVLENDGQIPMMVSQTSSPLARADPENCNPYWFFHWPGFHDFFSTISRFVTEEMNGVLEEDIDTQSATFVRWNNEAGRAALAAFEEAYGNANGQITERITVPPGESDMSTYVTNVEQSEDQLIVGFLPGQDGIRFVNAAANFGLKETKEFIFQEDTTNRIALGAEGEAANGWFGTAHYRFSRDTEINNQFKEWYSSNFDLPPNVLAANGFNQLYSLAQGMEAAGSTEPQAVIDALEGMSFSSPMGELAIRPEDHQIQQNFFSYQVNDRQHQVISEYTDVIPPVGCEV